MSGSGRGAEGRRRASRASPTIHFDDATSCATRSCSRSSRPTRRTPRRPSPAHDARRAGARPRAASSSTVTDGARPAACRARGLGAWLARRRAARGARGRVAIALVSDAAMRRLNAQFRGNDKATDVLSFPGRTPAAALPEPDGREPGGPRSLGDIAIALGVAARQAARAGPLARRRNCGFWPSTACCTSWATITRPTRGRCGRLEERLRRRAGLPVGPDRPGARSATAPMIRCPRLSSPPAGCCSSRWSRWRSALLMRLPQRLEAERESESDALAAYLDDPLKFFVPAAADARHAAGRSSSRCWRSRRPRLVAGCSCCSRSGIGICDRRRPDRCRR